MQVNFSKKIQVQAPAKVNLYLRVVGRRSDGFHELDTLFEAIDAHDTLTFSEMPSGIRLSTDHSTLPTGPKNLIYRAADLLRSTCGIRTGVRIHLKKTLPVAAGLGGGSSDAAITLLALNGLWKLQLSERKLLGLAAQLGSDIPFFILQKSFAIGQGRGEVLRPVPQTQLKLWHVLVTPRLHVLAKDVYAHLHKNPSWLKAPQADARMLAATVQKGDAAGLAPLMFNTLEFPVLSMHPTLGKIKSDLLQAGADTAIVSGSGPTVFGLVRSRREAQVLAAKIRKKHPSKRVTIASTATF